jgi:hypothetical protein
MYSSRRGVSLNVDLAASRRAYCFAPQVQQGGSAVVGGGRNVRPQRQHIAPQWSWGNSPLFC